MKREFDFSKEFGEINETFVEFAGREWKKNRYGIILLYSRKIACIALAVLLCIAAVSNENVQAAVREFTTRIGGALGFTKDLSSYTEILDQTQTKNGISLTLNEVILDDRILIVSLDMESEQGAEAPSVWVNEGKTTFNGKKRMAHESIVADGECTDLSKPPQNRILAEVYEDMYLPKGDIKVHLVLEAENPEVWGMDSMPEMAPDESVEGEAEFVYDFVVTSEELREKTVKQELDTVIGESGREDRSLTLKELTMNDLYGRIAATGVTWEDDWINEYDLKLKGTDSFGNPVCFDGIMFLTGNELLFTTSFDGDYESGEAIDEDEFHLSIPDKDCEYLDLQLYERKTIWETAEEITGGGEEDVAEEAAEAYEAYEKEENYGWAPVGKPFRISITR